MSITKIQYPTAGTPLVDIDYNLQNKLIEELSLKGTDSFILVNTLGVEYPPVLKLEGIIRHNLNLYKVIDTDYTILDTEETSGYIVLEGLGDSLTAKWVSDISDFSYDSYRNGFYDSLDNQLLRELALFEDAVYTIGFIFGMNPNQYYMNDGRFTYGTYGPKLYTNRIAPSLSSYIMCPNTSGLGYFTGLCTDGNNFISMHIYGSTYTVYVHDGVTDNILESFVLPSLGSGMLYLACDGTNLLVFNSTSGNLTVFDGISNTISSTITGVLNMSLYTFTGIAVDIYGNLVISRKLISLNTPEAYTIVVYDGISNTVVSSITNNVAVATANPVNCFTIDEYNNVIQLLKEVSTGTQFIYTSVGISSVLRSIVQATVISTGVGQGVWLDSRFHHILYINDALDNSYIVSYGSTPVQ